MDGKPITTCDKQAYLLDSRCFYYGDLEGLGLLLRFLNYEFFERGLDWVSGL